MRPPHADETRAETITAALIYLMSHYAQSGCPAWAEAADRAERAAVRH